MNIKPILFNAEMVRAILDGRKTVTRRVIKPRNPIRAKQEEYRQGYGLWIDPSTNNGDKQGHIKDYSISPLWSTWKWYIEHYAPYQISDTLYVRETWNGTRTGNEKVGFHTTYWYKADDKENNPDDKWRPSIHMPKEAARIWLRVTNIRVDRLGYTTSKDWEKEGIPKLYPPREMWIKFKELWDSTVPKGKEDIYGSEADPWVWVIEFERCEKPEVDR